MNRPRWPLVLLASIALISAAYAFADGAEDRQTMLWQALASGGHVALIRHAEAPGIGDPAEFDLDDCSTQRNLSEQGRAQAKAIGDRFRANGISVAQVQSSQWCRCLETAQPARPRQRPAQPGTQFLLPRRRSRNRNARPPLVN